RVDNAADQAHTGIVAEYIDGPEGGKRSIHHRLDAGLVAHIGQDGDRLATSLGNLSDEAVALVNCALGGDHARSLTGETDGNGAADPAAGASDDRYLAFKPSAHRTASLSLRHLHDG